MKHKLKIVSLAVMMALGSLTGCNGNSDESPVIPDVPMNPDKPDTPDSDKPDSSDSEQEEKAIMDITKYVDPFIGTSGTGHTFPGSVTPRGMIQVSPQTEDYFKDWWGVSSGYHDNFADIIGFGHTALSGTGINGLGNLHILPLIEITDGAWKEKAEKAVDDAPGWQKATAMGKAIRIDEVNFRQEIDKNTEIAKPGYYSVIIKDSGIKAEVTSTDRVGYHRYTFPEGSDKKVRILLDDHNTRSQFTKIEMVDEYTLRAQQTGKHFYAENQNVYFTIKLNQPITKFSLYDDSRSVEGTVVEDSAKISTLENGRRYWDYATSAAILEFDTDTNIVEAEVSISFTDEEGADKNLESEGGLTFDEAYVKNNNKWNDVLKTISVEGGTLEELTTFYTAFYHTNIAPHIFEDVDGDYRAMTNNDQILVKHNDSEDKVYSIYSLWDTFRAVHPLKTITQPEHAVELAKDLIRKYEDGGLLPRWELHGDYTGVMIGYPAVAVLADAIIKYPDEFTKEELNKALEASIATSNFDPDKYQDWNPKILDLVMKPQIQNIDFDCVDNIDPKAPVKKGDNCGWVVGKDSTWTDSPVDSVSWGLEMANFDWAISKIAAAAGDKKMEERYIRRSQLWHKYWSPSIEGDAESDFSKHNMTGFMRPVMPDGTFMKDFNPYWTAHEQSNYTEGTSWQWTWFVPHDVNGLINIMGGEESFRNNLERTFSADCKDTYPDAENCVVTADMTGMIGQVAIGNEPSHHIPFLFNWTETPWRTQEIVDYIQKEFYGVERDDVIGNEDVGQMSAWYVMASLGFYQVSASDPVYTVARPLFDKAVIPVKGGEFTITTENNNPVNMYIKSVSINGKPLGSDFTFTQNELKAGGDLHFVMTGDKSEAAKANNAK